MKEVLVKRSLMLAGLLAATGAYAGTGGPVLSAAPLFDLSIDASGDGVGRDWSSLSSKQAITDVDGSAGNLFNQTVTFAPVSGPAAGLFALDYNINFNPDPLLTGTIGVTNLSGVVQTFTINLSLPVTPALLAPTQYRGNISATVFDRSNNALAALADVSGNGIYAGTIDNAVSLPLLPLFGQDITCSSGALCTASGSDQSTGFPAFLNGGPAVNTKIGTSLVFSLTPGDRATFNTTFEVQASPVPVPAAVWLLSSAVAGLGIVRRRVAG